MRLVLATSDLVVEGRSFEGFPLLLGKDGWPVEPAHEFLWETLVHAGGAESLLTWEAYGRRMYDYFSFLEANNLYWDQEPTSQSLSVLTKYRDWSVTELGLNPSTINKRLSLITRFYQWSKRKGYVECLPFAMRASKRNAKHGFLAHAKTGDVLSTPSVMLREHKPTLQLLTKEQIKNCQQAKLDASHRVLFDLMARTGLRSCEARTFPLKYVFNPRTRRGIHEGHMIRVELHPSDMHLKFGKSRSIDVPWSLMEDLWSYSLHQREIRRKKSNGNPRALTLTAFGAEFTKGAVVDAMKCIEKKVGFHVRAHMLRHTYGTFTLSTLRKSKDFQGEPLLYVRDRMGHSSVETTAIYLHLVNQLDAQAVLAHEDEMDLAFGKEQSSEKRNMNGTRQGLQIKVADPFSGYRKNGHQRD